MAASLDQEAETADFRPPVARPIDESAQHRMPLLTPEMRVQLLANARHDVDHMPLVKFLNPVGIGI